MKKLIKIEKKQTVSSVSMMSEIICDECGKSHKFEEPVHKNLLVPDWIHIEILDYGVDTQIKDACSKSCLMKLLDKEYTVGLRIVID